MGTNIFDSTNKARVETLNGTVTEISHTALLTVVGMGLSRCSSFIFSPQFHFNEALTHEEMPNVLSISHLPRASPDYQESLVQWHRGEEEHGGEDRLRKETTKQRKLIKTQ